jgi:hypothetical protein
MATNSPASPDLAERIIRKAKHIRQRVQTKPQKNSAVPRRSNSEERKPMKKTANARNWFYFLSRPTGPN